MSRHKAKTILLFFSSVAAFAFVLYTLAAIFAFQWKHYCVNEVGVVHHVGAVMSFETVEGLCDEP